MSDQDTPTSRRSSMTALLLGGTTALFFSVFLVVATGGFFLYVLGLGAVIGGLIAFHYYAWGKSFADATAGERDELEALEREARDAARPVSRER